MADPEVTTALRLEVVPEDVSFGPDDELRAALTNHPVVRFQYPNADLWFVGLDQLDKGPHSEDDQGGRFRAVLHDLAGNEVLEAFGWLNDPGMVEVIPTSRVRLPSDDEHAWALAQIRNDVEVARRLDEGELVAYRPMPPLAGRPQADGAVERAVTIGLFDTTASGEPRHRIVTLRTSDGEIIEKAPGVPPPSNEECGVPLGHDAVTGSPATAPGSHSAQQARVRVWRGDELLWDLLVARPAASSGATGSGVELREVDHQRVRVLHRAHLPILNTAYADGDAHRDWLNDESPFEAEGEEPVPGFRVCDPATPPRTIFERGEGGGNFRGVALWLDGDELAIVSQLQTGWHRFVCEWRLHADGTIRPRFGATAVSNPVTCRPLLHHAYWRLDFDVVTTGANQVQEYNEPPLAGQLNPWLTVHYEVRRHRSAEHDRRWRVRDKRSSHGYTVIPGPADGIADQFGAGDVWILAYHGEEIDDGQGFTAEPALARAQLDSFVSGEWVERADTVLWYAAHIDPAADTGMAGLRGPNAVARLRGPNAVARLRGPNAMAGLRGPNAVARLRGPNAMVGPDLEPFNWRPPVERTYVPIEPPPLDDEPRD